MSPEVALLARAALLGLFVFAIERFGRRRQARRAELRRTLIRLPATRYPEAPPLTGRPVQVEVAQAVKPVAAQAGRSRTDIVRLEPYTPPTYVTERTFDGHVTEKRAA